MLVAAGNIVDAGRHTVAGSIAAAAVVEAGVPEPVVSGEPDGG